jgi:hypothetical protein
MNLKMKTGHQGPEVRHVKGFNKYFGSNKPLVSIWRKTKWG